VNAVSQYRRGGDDFVAALAQNDDGLRADQPVPPITTIFIPNLQLVARRPGFLMVVRQHVSCRDESLPSSPGRVAVRRVVMRVDRAASFRAGPAKNSASPTDLALFGCSFGTMGTTARPSDISGSHVLGGHIGASGSAVLSLARCLAVSDQT